MSNKSLIALGGVYFFFFLLLTPLGVFNEWIPPQIQTGYYSVTQIDGGDDTGYYAYLRSFFFDGDFDFINERGYAHAETLTPTGYIFNNWQIGLAWLYFPFFLIGHALAWCYAALGYSVTHDGYSAPYYLMTAVASGTWLFIGLLFTTFMLKKLVGNWQALVVTLGIWLASPLIYFSFIRQRMAHTLEFALAAAFVFAWLQFRRSEDWLRHAFIGSVLGLLCLVRILNVSFFSLYGVDLLLFVLAQRKAGSKNYLKNSAIRLTAFLGGFFVVMLPQIFTWWRMNGIPLPSRHLHYAEEGLTQFSLLPFLDSFSALFFDPKWGLIFSMPLAVIGLLGLFIKNDFLKEIRYPLLAQVFALMALITIYPEDSASYGHRHLISILPILALGLGVVVSTCLRLRGLWPVLFSVIVLGVLAQYFMVVQYKVTLPYNHETFSLTAISSIPHLLAERSDLLLRSSNFFKLMIMDRLADWNYRDGLFLIVFPIFQLAIILGSVWMMFAWNRNARWIQNLFRPGALFARSMIGSVVLLIIVVIALPKMEKEQIQNRQLYKEFLTEGDAKLKSQKIVSARDSFLKAAERLPELWNPWFKIGLTWNIQGDLEQANANYLKGLKRHPTNSQVLTSVGDNLRRFGKLPEAETKLKQAIRAWPKNKRAYDVLAQLYLGQNRAREAEAMLLTSVSIDPNYGVGHANLAVLYTVMKQPEKSVAHLNRAIQLGVRGPVIDKLSQQYR